MSKVQIFIDKNLYWSILLMFCNQNNHLQTQILVTADFELGKEGSLSCQRILRQDLHFEYIVYHHIIVSLTQVHAFDIFNTILMRCLLLTLSLRTTHHADTTAINILFLMMNFRNSNSPWSQVVLFEMVSILVFAMKLIFCHSE